MDQIFKPITVVGLNSKSEIEFDINLVMKMFHAYIAYLPIEQRSTVEQLQISDQMLKIQKLYNDEQKSAIEYMEKKAAEEELKAAGIDPHYKERGPEEQNIDDLMESVRKSNPIDMKYCENCDGVGEIEMEGIGFVDCTECGGSGYAK